MARNKYPEQTVERILEVSTRLFLEKGYDNTSLQDILNELKGCRCYSKKGPKTRHIIIENSPTWSPEPVDVVR